MPETPRQWSPISQYADDMLAAMRKAFEGEIWWDGGDPDNPTPGSPATDRDLEARTRATMLSQFNRDGLLLLRKMNRLFERVKDAAFTPGNPLGASPEVKRALGMCVDEDVLDGVDEEGEPI